MDHAVCIDVLLDGRPLRMRPLEETSPSSPSSDTSSLFYAMGKCAEERVRTTLTLSELLETMDVVHGPALGSNIGIGTIPTPLG